SISEKLDVPGLVNIIQKLIDSDKEKWFIKATELSVGGEATWISMHQLLPKIINLETIKQNLKSKSHRYFTYRQFYEDLEQIWTNCDIFWSTTHPQYCVKADELRKEGRTLFLLHLKALEAAKSAENSRLHGVELEKA